MRKSQVLHKLLSEAGHRWREPVTYTVDVRRTSDVMHEPDLRHALALLDLDDECVVTACSAHYVDEETLRVSVTALPSQ